MIRDSRFARAAAIMALLAAINVSALAAQKQTFTGEVGDAMCGSQHMEGTPAECTRTCVSKGSKYALVVGDKIYVLNTTDRAARATLDKQAGKKATVTGIVNGDSIDVVRCQTNKVSNRPFPGYFRKTEKPHFAVPADESCGRVNRFCPGPPPKNPGTVAAAAPAVAAIFLSPTVKFIFPLQPIVLDCAFFHLNFGVPEVKNWAKTWFPSGCFSPKESGNTASA